MAAAGTFCRMLANDPGKLQNVFAAWTFYIYTCFSVFYLVPFERKEFADLCFDLQKSEIFRLSFLNVFWEYSVYRIHEKNERDAVYYFTGNIVEIRYDNAYKHKDNKGKSKSM